MSRPLTSPKDVDTKPVEKGDGKTQPENEVKPEPKEETKENAKKMSFKGIGSKLLSSAVSGFKDKMKQNDVGFYDMFSKKENISETEVQKSTPKEILGKIYKALVRANDYRKLQYEESRGHLAEQNLEKNKKNKEIINALVGFVPKKKKEKEQPTEEKQPENKTTVPEKSGKQNKGGRKRGGQKTGNLPSTTPTPKTTTPVNNRPTAPTAPAPVTPTPARTIPAHTTPVATPVAPVNVPTSNVPENKAQTTASPLSKSETPFKQSMMQNIITSPIGYREMGNRTEFHKGVDLRAPVATKLYSVGEGKVIEVGDDGNKERGKYIKLQLDDGNIASYFHLSDTSAVKQNDKISKGSFIGLSGNTGKSLAPHLHFEMHDKSGKLITDIPKEIIDSTLTPKVKNTAIEEKANIQPITASKLPELIEDKIVELQFGDPGWFPFMSKLQKAYDGHWYRDGDLKYPVKPEIERFAEEKLKSTSNILKQSPVLDNKGNIIDKNSSEIKNNKEKMGLKQNEELVSQINNTVIINKNNSTRKVYMDKIDDENTYLKKLQG